MCSPCDRKSPTQWEGDRQEDCSDVTWCSQNSTHRFLPWRCEEVASQEMQLATKSEKSQRQGFSPGPPERHSALPTHLLQSSETDMRFLTFRTVRWQICVGWNHSVCGHLVQQPEKTNPSANCSQKDNPLSHHAWHTYGVSGFICYCSPQSNYHYLEITKLLLLGSSSSEFPHRMTNTPICHPVPSLASHTCF